MRPNDANWNWNEVRLRPAEPNSSPDHLAADLYRKGGKDGGWFCTETFHIEWKRSQWVKEQREARNARRKQVRHQRAVAAQEDAAAD